MCQADVVRELISSFLTRLWYGISLATMTSADLLENKVQYRNCVCNGGLIRLTF